MNCAPDMRFSSLKPWHKHLLVIFLYALITLVMTYPLALRLDELPVDVTDPEVHLHRDSFIFLWTFWWLRHSLFDLHVQPFFSNYLFHPHGTSLVFLPFAAVYAVVSLLFQLLMPGEQGVIVAYSVVVFCSFTLAGYGMYLIALAVAGDRRAAFVAGLIFSFCANRVWNLSALNLFCYEFVAFFVFFLILFLRNPSVRYGICAGVFYALLCYSSLEYALFCSLLVVLMFMARVIKGFDGDQMKALVKGGGAALLSYVVVSAPLLYGIWSFMKKSTLSHATMDLGMPAAFSNDLASFVIPSFHQKFYDTIIDFRALYARGIDWRVIGLKSFLGYTALGLAIIGVIKGAAKDRWLWLVSTLFFLMLSMGPYLHAMGMIYQNCRLPYLFLYNYIPFFQVARAPERMIVLVMLSVAVLSAYGAATIFRWRPALGTVLAVAFALMVLVENFFGPLKNARLPVPDVYRQMGAEKADYAIWDIPMDEDMRPISMYFQVVHQKPILTGQVPRHSAGATSLLRSNSLLRAVYEDKMASYYLEVATNPGRQSEIRHAHQTLVENRTRYIVLHTWHMRHQEEAIARKLIELLQPVETSYIIPYMKGAIVVYRMY